VPGIMLERLLSQGGIPVVVRTGQGGAAGVMRAYPNVLRGLGIAIAVTFPSCWGLTCSRLDIPTPSCAREYEPVVVDRKVAPDGTEFCVTQVLTPAGEPYKIWFNVRRPGEGWMRYFLGNEPFWIGQIELRRGEKTAIARYNHNEVVFDWAHGYALPHYEHVIMPGTQPAGVADPFAREGH